MTERDFAINVVRRLRDKGFEALFAGGCVRDELMGLEPHDFDVATDACPAQVQQLFRHTFAVGASFGVVEIIGPRVGGEHLKVQVATFRSDGNYSDERRPDSVTFSTAREDALRRDFTINGMFFDPLENRLIDYVGGQADLKAMVLRAIGEPRERFGEDKLRLLRAVRFAARFGFALDEGTATAVREMAPRIGVVSVERIGDELRKLLTHRHRARGLSLMHEVGLMPAIFPELTVIAEALAVVAALPETVSFPLAFAAMLHGVERDAARAIALRLRLSNAERERVEWLVSQRRSLFDGREIRPSRLKPLLAHAGIHELIWLWSAAGELDPPPLLTGDDLKALGLPPGPLFKRVLDAVRERQLDGGLATRQSALAFVQTFLTGTV